MVCFRGVVYHLAQVMIHNIKPNLVGYHHVEGFQDCSMCKENKWGLEIATRVE